MRILRAAVPLPLTCLAAAAAVVGVLSPPASGAEAATCAGRDVTITVTDEDLSDPSGSMHGLPEWSGPGTDDVILVDVSVETLPDDFPDDGGTIGSEDGVTAVIHGGGGSDVVCGSALNDVILGDAGDDEVHGLGGDDWLYGDALVPEWSPEAGVNRLDGGLGDDVFLPGAGTDEVYDAGGRDVLDFIRLGPVLVDVPVHEATTGGAGTVRWFDRVERYRLGSDGGNEFIGGPSTDIVDSFGDDDVRTGAGDDVVWAGDSGVVDTGDGADRVFVRGYSTDSISVEAPDIALGAGHDRVWWFGKATVDGGTGNDTIYPGVRSRDFDQRVRGTFEGGPGTDRIDLRHANAGVRLYLDSQRATWDGSLLTLLRVERSTGSRFDDVLAGDALANQLSGGDGNDRLVGRAGNDNLVGDGGRDRAEGGSGRDRCSAEVRLSC